MLETSIIIGIIAATLGVSGFIYQTIKNPIGMTYPIIIFTGISVSLWGGYGVVLNNPILYIPNIIIVGTLVIIGVRKVKN